MRLPRLRLSCILLCCLAMNNAAFASPHHHQSPHKGGARYKDSAKYKDLAQYKSVEALPQKTRGHFEILGGIGGAQLNSGNGELGVTQSETDELVQTNKNAWDAITGQLGLGYVYYFGNAQQYSDQVQLFPSIEPELNLYQLSSNSIKGDVYRYNSAAFNDLTFDIPVHSTRLMVDAALTLASYKKVSVYGIGGIGNAWNRLSYSDHDNSGSGSGDTSSPCPDQRLSLNSKTRSHFVWEAGAGLTFAFNDRVGLSAEYLFVDLGKVSTPSSGNTGSITAPVIVPAKFNNLKSQAGILALHIAL